MGRHISQSGSEAARDVAAISPRAHAVDRPREAEIQRLRADLASRDRTIEELRHSVAELRQELRVRDDFIATASHELRNPMGAMLMGVTNMLFLARRGPEQLPSWLSSRLEGLERQARNFVRRATTLLDATRLASGTAAVDPQLLEMGPIVEAVVRELDPEAERAGSELHGQIQPGVEGWWDRSAIESIALNLVSNAIKYGAGKPVWVTVSATAASATLVVSDQGVGITPEAQGRIFERFERAGAPGHTHGFGVGLWIARQLARAHGGDIHVESTPGSGSIFTATLPRAIHELNDELP